MQATKSKNVETICAKSGFCLSKKIPAKTAPKSGAKKTE
jgi:hypothetical protein